MNGFALGWAFSHITTCKGGGAAPAQVQVDVQVANTSLLGVATSLQSVHQVAGKFVVHKDVTVQVAISKLLKIQAAIVQAFIIKNTQVDNTKVSVFATAEVTAELNVRVTVPALFATLVIVLSSQIFAAVQDINLTVLHTANPFIKDVVVIVVVLHQVAV